MSTAGARPESSAGGQDALRQPQPPAPGTPPPAPVPADGPTVISNAPPLPTPGATTDWARQLVGQQLEHFRLDSLIGGGGMGVVFRATDLRLNRTVALKVLSQMHAQDPETVRRFQNEARSAARLDHENIARVYYVGRDRGLYFIVFEYIQGINLRDLVARQGPLPVAQALQLLFQVAQALAHAHSRNVVHRDVKPSNVLITPDGKAKLVDMGLARLHEVDQSHDLTASGVTLGTFDYISPEQARDPRNVDIRSDIYSLGCTLFFVLTGRPPFPHGTVLQKLLQHQNEPPPKLRELNPQLPEELSQLVHHMLAKDPAQRFQTPGELIGQIVRVADQLGVALVGEVPLSLPQPSWRDRSWLLAVRWLVPLGVLALLALGVQVAISWTSQPIRPPLELATTPSPPTPESPLAPSGPSSGPPPREAPDPGDDIPGQRPLPPASSGGQQSDTGEGTTGEAGATSTDSEEQPSAAPTPADDSSSGPGHLGPSQSGTLGAAVGSVELGPQAAGAELLLADVPQGVPSSPSPQPSAQPQPPPPGVWVVDPQADSDPRVRVVPTLREAAERVASGEVIELRFNGPGAQRPWQWNQRRVTIRAAPGYRPELLFAPEDPDPVQQPRQMISLREARVRFLGVALRLDLSGVPASQGWSLFQLDRGAELELDDCVLTVVNASGSRQSFHPQVRFFALAPAGSKEAMMMPMSPPEELPQLRITLRNTVVRGEAMLVQPAAGAALHLEWLNGFWASPEPMLVFEESGSAQGRTPFQLQLRLDHLTALLDGGLVRAQLATSAESLHWHLVCENSLLLSSNESPLFQITAPGDPQSAWKNFRWSGQSNFLLGFQTLLLWQGQQPDQRQSLDRSQWAELPGVEDASLENAPVRWHRPLPQQQPYHQLAPSQFRLHPAAGNPALRAGTDNKDAGADLDLLPAAPTSQPSAPE